MKGHGPAYNVQTVVDAEHALIVTHEVTTDATDNTSLSDGEAARDALAAETMHRDRQRRRKRVRLVQGPLRPPRQSPRAGGAAHAARATPRLRRCVVED